MAGDEVVLDSATHNITSSLLEAGEGEGVELGCSGARAGSYHGPEYSWSLATGGDTGDWRPANTSQLNITAAVAMNGSVLVCSSAQYNVYTGQLLATTSATITLVVRPRTSLLSLGSVAASPTRLATLVLVAALLGLLLLGLGLAFAIRRHKPAPGAASSTASQCSDPGPRPYPSPVWQSGTNLTLPRHNTDKVQAYTIIRFRM